MKASLIGRPGRVVETQDLVITMMTQMDAPESFPKGALAPPAPPTVHTVCVAAKQWKTAAQAIRKPADRLIIGGFAAFAPGLEGTAIFATNAATKILQQKRQAPGTEARG